MSPIDKVIISTARAAAKLDSTNETKRSAIVAELATIAAATYAEYKELAAAWRAEYMRVRSCDEGAARTAWSRYDGPSLNPNRAAAEKAEETTDTEATEQVTPEPIDYSPEALTAAYAAHDWKLCRAIIRTAQEASKVATA